MPAGVLERPDIAIVAANDDDRLAGYNAVLRSRKARTRFPRSTSSSSVPPDSGPAAFDAVLEPTI